MTVDVNNSPAGAAVVTPGDGARIRGTRPVIAALPTGGKDHVESLAVDDKPAENAEALATGTATLGLRVEAGNSIEARYQNYALVNGHRVDLGGDYGATGAEDVRLAFPTRFLHLGDNVVEVRTGDYNGTLNGATCANHDDFTLNREATSLTLSTAGTVTAGTTYVVTTSGTTVTKAETTAATWRWATAPARPTGTPNFTSPSTAPRRPVRSTPSAAAATRT